MILEKVMVVFVVLDVCVSVCLSVCMYVVNMNVYVCGCLMEK